MQQEQQRLQRTTWKNNEKQKRNMERRGLADRKAPLFWAFSCLDITVKNEYNVNLIEQTRRTIIWQFLIIIMK